MDHGARRTRISELLSTHEIDAVLVTRPVNVRYLSGFTGSNGQLLLPTGDGEAVLLTDGRYEEQSRREVPDIRRIVYARGLSSALPPACEELGVSRLGFEPSGVSFGLWEQLREAEAELVPIGDEIEKLRWSKDRDEIRLLERAQEITDEAFERVVGKLAEGVTERDTALELEIAMRQAGADAVGFDTIVAFGENAAEPHHRPTERPLSRGDVVKLDFGCVVAGYHSDMTRTVAFGDPGEELRAVYGIVREAQRVGAEAVRAGATGAAADAAAREVIEASGHGDEFGHSLGHGVGLEIHEGPTLRRGSDDVLPEGAVVTVEPGIYLPGVGGVRIEDAVVVHAVGCRPLPRTPKELIEL